MEFKEIIVWLGLVAIIVIVWDGLRRMKTNKRKPRVDEGDYVDPEELERKAVLARELPNGGARVREMTDNEKDEIQNKLNLRERVPMLMERVEVEEDEADLDEEIEDQLQQSELDFSVDDSVEQAQPLADQENDDDEDSTEELQPFDSIDDEHIEPYFGSALDDDLDFVDAKDELPAPEPVKEEQPEAEESQPEDGEEEKLGPVEELVIMHVMARNDGELSGSKVLELLLTAGLRHGPMEIFHYRNPQGHTEFSLANCVQPGTFNPDSMNQVNTPGVTLFMQLPTSADAMESLDHMYEMALYLAKNLDAEVLDEDHSTVTKQRIESYREKLRSFARSKLLPS